MVADTVQAVTTWSRQVGIYEAKTRFAQIVAEAEAGETIVITRHGRPVAVLGPVRDQPRPDVNETIDALIRLQATLPHRTPGDPTVREMIEEGRR